MLVGHIIVASIASRAGNAASAIVLEIRKVHDSVLPFTGIFFSYAPAGYKPS
jgi:hypothetical protein